MREFYEISKTVNKFISAGRRGINYLRKNPIDNLAKLLNWAEKLAVKEEHKK